MVGGPARHDNTMTGDNRVCVYRGRIERPTERREAAADRGWCSERAYLDCAVKPRGKSYSPRAAAVHAEIELNASPEIELTGTFSVRSLRGTGSSSSYKVTPRKIETRKKMSSPIDPVRNGYCIGLLHCVAQYTGSRLNGGPGRTENGPSSGLRNTVNPVHGDPTSFTCGNTVTRCCAQVTKNLPRRR